MGTLDADIPGGIPMPRTPRSHSPTPLLTPADASPGCPENRKIPTMTASMGRAERRVKGQIYCLDLSILLMNSKNKSQSSQSYYIICEIGKLNKSPNSKSKESGVNITYPLHGKKVNSPKYILPFTEYKSTRTAGKSLLRISAIRSFFQTRKRYHHRFIQKE